RLSPALVGRQHGAVQVGLRGRGGRGGGHLQALAAGRAGLLGAALAGGGLQRLFAVGAVVLDGRLRFGEHGPAVLRRRGAGGGRVGGGGAGGGGGAAGPCRRWPQAGQGFLVPPSRAGASSGFLQRGQLYLMVASCSASMVWP